MTTSQYWYEDPSLKESIMRDPDEAFRQCLLLVESDVSKERYRAAYALGDIARLSGANGLVNQEDVYKAIWQLIKKSLEVEDWEAGAAAIVSLGSSMKQLPAEIAPSPMSLVELCGNISRPLIWQRVLQHLYCFYRCDSAVGTFLETYLQDDEAPFRDIAEATLVLIREEQ